MALFGIFDSRTSLENPAVPLTDAGLLSWMIGPPTDAGVRVEGEYAMKMAAFYRGAALLSNLGGALPIKVYKKGTKQPASSVLIDNPHTDMTELEFWRLSYMHRILHGNFYAQKIRTESSGRISYLEPIDPRRVKVGRARQPSANNPSGKIFEVTDEDGEKHVYTPTEIFHIPGLGFNSLHGVSVIKFASQSIGLSVAAEKYGAKLFGSGNLLSGILTTDSVLDQEQASSLQERWERMTAGIDRAHRVAVLDSGATFESLTMPNDDAQLLESRDFQVTEIARFLGIPPYLMFQTEKTTSWGTGLEQQARGFTQFDLHPGWLGPTEQRITKELLAFTGNEARYDMTALMRGDSIARAEFYRVMREAGVLNPNEIRDQEDLPPREGGDTYLDPMPGSSINDPQGTNKVLGGGSLGPPDSGV